MVPDPQLYQTDWHLSNNVGLTYNDPYSRKIHLFTMSTTAMKNMGIKKPIDIVGHWAICVNGWVFELGRDITQKKKKDQYGYRPIQELAFVRKRKDQGKDIMYGYIGDLVLPYSPGQIDEIAKLVWELSLRKKYVYDEYNCQVFIRLLVEIIGDYNARANFPAFLDKWVKGAQNTRDGGSFAFAAGATLIAAGPVHGC
ncbi:uncharacterized protein M421DRAFT_96869 [Didymella exigua CBS 183.55]|uniref:Uncharacterized protein n=1 Tax=Didymella exigua CBS 183.55 TaxID=1150837 RepID=A0A6A5R2F6_9PLEO|nr:uncharacterized protein M421DRAFT_96869 [Didymella exigua CBS 183.55]KAF1922231.1 hypothetical protein M421DRAFT_96869 [Didymella exigua CBS 183.55]